MKRSTARKAWKCDECGKDFDQGTTVYRGRYGVMLHRPGFGVVHVDVEGRLCSRCYGKYVTGASADAGPR